VLPVGGEASVETPPCGIDTDSDLLTIVRHTQILKNMSLAFRAITKRL